MDAETCVDNLRAELARMADRAASLTDTLNGLRGAVDEALDGWEDTMSYVDPYFVTKHGYDADVARLRAMVKSGGE
jgi:hypothetical protein